MFSVNKKEGLRPPSLVPCANLDGLRGFVLQLGKLARPAHLALPLRDHLSVVSDRPLAGSYVVDSTHCLGHLCDLLSFDGLSISLTGLFVNRHFAQIFLLKLPARFYALAH